MPSAFACDQQADLRRDSQACCRVLCPPAPRLSDAAQYLFRMSSRTAGISLHATAVSDNDSVLLAIAAEQVAFQQTVLVPYCARAWLASLAHRCQSLRQPLGVVALLAFDGLGPAHKRGLGSTAL